MANVESLLHCEPQPSERYSASVPVILRAMTFAGSEDPGAVLDLRDERGPCNGTQMTHSGK